MTSLSNPTAAAGSVSPPGQRAAKLEAYDASGLSGRKFAQLHGINYQTFAAWVQRRKRQAAPAPAAAWLFSVRGGGAGLSHLTGIAD